jgi:hypothetical protein
VGPSTPQAGNERGARADATPSVRKKGTVAQSAGARATRANAGDDPSASSGREFVHAPSNRTNIALPFSKIQLQEPSAELSEVAGLLCELIEALEDVDPKARHKQLNDLHARARALRARMR